MRTLRSRVEALEADAGANPNAIHRAAYERIFAALRASLPIVPATERLVDCEMYSALQTVSEGVSFEELITGLHRRMQAGALTDDDRRVLAALPVEDLEMTGSSPESVVETFGRLYSDY